jgi:hypothetical protein
MVIEQNEETVFFLLLLGFEFVYVVKLEKKEGIQVEFE